MRKKCNILALCSFVLALAIFTLSFFLYHYMLPDGSFTNVFQIQPGKPFVTLLFGIWGVTFLVSGVMSLLIGFIFFNDK